jgi:KTSC domain-containing protein
VVGRSIVRLRAVQSEMLDLIGYDPNAHILEVVFTSGDHYRYFAVPPHEYEGLASADSIGQYMHTHIIGRYDYERVI